MRAVGGTELWMSPSESGLQERAMSLFAAAELGAELDKASFKEQQPELRIGLVNAQTDLKQADFPVLIHLFGDDRLGCDEVIDRLNEWMDPRDLATEVFGPPSEEERERPPMWRFWRVFPPRGRAALLHGSWTLETLAAEARGELDPAELDRRVEHFRRLERMLVEDGALVLKFWLHLPKAEFKRRLKRARKDPEEHFRVEERDARIFETYDDLLPRAEDLLRTTSLAEAPWHVVESTDARHRDVAVARTILESLRSRLDSPPAAPALAAASSAPVVSPGGPGRLAATDLSARLERDEYEERLEQLQSRLSQLSREARGAGLSTVLALEGWDAAGKGGAIRRMTGAMSARDYRVFPVAAPTEEERAQHWLWRFWRRLPRAGRMAIFDRSWYGRVLVERVEGFAAAHEGGRAYDEILDFEEQLVEHGWVLRKFWLHVGEDEQARRFEARAETPYKKYKLTAEDHRNRTRRADYEVAVDEMLARTDWRGAPWTVVAADDKRHARITVLAEVCSALEQGLAER